MRPREAGGTLAASTASGSGLAGADLQAGGGERLHDPPEVQAELPDAATRAAPGEHERVWLRGVGLEVALLSLGARALLVPGLRGREATGEPCDSAGSPPVPPASRAAAPHPPRLPHAGVYSTRIFRRPLPAPCRSLPALEMWSREASLSDDVTTWV